MASPTAEEIARAVTENIKNDPEFVFALCRNLRVMAAVQGMMTTGGRFRELKGLPGAPHFRMRHDMYQFLLTRQTGEGAILEFGVAAGESIRAFGAMLPDREIWGFDSFEGLPEAWHEHGAGSYTQHGKLPEVPSNVHLVKGWFEDTLEGFIEQNAAYLANGVAFLHMDADIYSATAYVLKKIKPYLKVGTIISFDEYWNTVTWEHDEHKAWMEFLADNPSVKFSYVGYVPTDTQLAVRIDAI